MCFLKVTKSLGSSDQDPLTLAGLGLAGILLPMALAKSIRKGARDEKLGFQNLTQLSVLKAEVWLGARWTGFFSGKVSLPFPWSPWNSLNPLTLLIWYVFPGRGLRLWLCRLQEMLQNYAGFTFKLSILRHSCEKFFFKKTQRSILSHVFQVQGVLRSEQ